MDYRNNKDYNRSDRDRYNNSYRRDRYNTPNRDGNYKDRYEHRRPDNRQRPGALERDSFEYIPTPRIPTGPRGLSQESLAPRTNAKNNNNTNDNSNNNNSINDRNVTKSTKSNNNNNNNSNNTTPKRPRDELRSPRHDYSSDRRKISATETKSNRGLKNLPSGPRSNRLGRDSFVPVNGVKPFTRPTEVLKSRSKLGFNDELSDDEERLPRYDSRVQLKKSKVYLQVSTRNTPPYERILQVGEGTYGKVYKAKNNVTGRLVALKRLRLETEKEGFPITAMREISLLQSFQNENISGMLEIMSERNLIYMISDYLEHDLAALLTHPAVDMNEANRKDIFKQLLNGISYLHEKKIMHRDIKGSNILADKNGVIKITDFGLARKMKNHKIEESPQYTNRVITLWYRPPELLMGSTDYGREVDMWGLGCLLIELFTKKAAFQGNNEITQLQKIFKIMGTPSYSEWPEMDDLPWYHLLKPEPHKKVFNALYDKHLGNESCIRLCEGLLMSNPQHRYSAKKALESDWFTTLPKPERLHLEGLEELHEYEVKKRRKAKVLKAEAANGEGGSFKEKSLPAESDVSQMDITNEVDVNV